MRPDTEKKENQKNMELRKIVPDFERWPNSWMGPQEDLEYGKKILPIMEEFIQHLITQKLSRKTLKTYIDNVWVLGGTIIRNVSIYKWHKKDPWKKILEEVESGGCLPDHYDSMSEEELASFETMCKGFEKFLKKLSNEGSTDAEKNTKRNL